MGFIGEEGAPAPQLNEIEVTVDYGKLAAELIASIRQMVGEAKLVHGDLSPYNVLFSSERPYIIDLAQAVPVTHPRALELLEQDLLTLKAFFRKSGVQASLFEETLVELAREVVAPEPERLDKYGRRLPRGSRSLIRT